MQVALRVLLAGQCAACSPVTVLDDGTGQGLDSASQPSWDGGAGDGGTDALDTDTDAAHTDPPDTGTEDVPGVSYEHVPVLLIDTDGDSITDYRKTSGTLEVLRDHDGTLGDLETALRSWSGPVGIQVHGSSSQGYEKLGYRIETRDDAGEDLDTELLGMPDGSDWVLHAPYSDKTLMRNAFTYATARALAEDFDRYEVRNRFAEVFINDRYKGVYLVVERVRRGKNRLGLPAPAATQAEGDLSGGYIVKIDQHRGDGWDTLAGTPVDYHYPRYDDITPQQDQYLRQWFNSFESAVAADFSAETYQQWIDTDSFVDHYIINELTHNIDAYRLSAYLHKRPDAEGGLLHAGPAWDFDRALGNVNYCDCWEIEGFTIDSLTECGYPEQYPFWWFLLREDPDFTDRLRCRWDALRQDGAALSDDALLARYGELIEELEIVEPRDHEQWDTLGEYVDPNYYVGETWEDELNWLQDWTLDRAYWLDLNMPGTCAEGDR